MRHKLLQLVQIFKFCLFNIFSLLLLIVAPSSTIWRIRPNSASQWTKYFTAFFLTVWRSVPKNHASVWLWLGFDWQVLIYKVSILYIVQFVLSKLIFSLLHLKVGQKWVLCWAYSPKQTILNLQKERLTWQFVSKGSQQPWSAANYHPCDDAFLPRLLRLSCGPYGCLLSLGHYQV